MNKVAQLKKELDSLLNGDTRLVDQIMNTLDRERIIYYQSDGEVALFSTAGRVLYCLMQDPSMTQRALAVYLGLSETMVEKTIKTLMEQGLITKTKLNRKNVYDFNKDLLINHADIQRIPMVLTYIKEMRQRSHQVEEEPPF